MSHQELLAADWIAMAMITAPRSLVTIHTAISSLRLAKFGGELHVFAEPGSEVPAMPGVVVHRNPHQRKMWPNWTQAAEFLLRETSAPFLLIMEDDFEVANCASSKLMNLLCSANPERFGFASLYLPKYNVNESSSPQNWYPLGRQDYAWGSQAYCFSRRSLSKILQTEMIQNHRGSEETDSLISEAAKAISLDIYAHSPSLLCHAGGDYSTVGHRPGGVDMAADYDANLQYNFTLPRAAYRGIRRGCIVSILFGEWPASFANILERCAENEAFDWLFFTHHEIPCNLPANVHFVTTNLSEFQQFAAEQIDCDLKYSNLKNMANLRPMFGQIFREYLQDYEFYGWGDCEIINCDLVGQIPPHAWREDSFSLQSSHHAGNIWFFRNHLENRHAYQHMPNWRESIVHENSCVFVDDFTTRIRSTKSPIKANFVLPSNSFSCPFSLITGRTSEVTRAATLPPVQSLWIGNRLSLLEQLCIASFLEMGHPFHLYTYNECSDVPSGAMLFDANKIIPNHDIMRLGQGHIRSAADIFRYKLLHLRGGWWVDMDMLCMRSLPFTNDHMLGWEDECFINNAIMHAPIFSKLMSIAYERAIIPEFAANPPATAPPLITQLLKEQGKLSYAVSKGTFYPVHWSEAEELIRPWRPIPNDCYTIHAWREIWMRTGLSFNGPFPITSIMGQLHRKLAHRLPALCQK